MVNAPELTLPETAIPYALYQRTHYVLPHPLYYFFTVLGYASPLYKWSVMQKAKHFSKEIEQAFWKDMEQEYQMLSSSLPENVSSILDIGAGLGGVDVFLSRHFGHRVEMHLLDKTAVDDSIHYHLHPVGSFYNSLSLAKDILVQNAVPESHVHLHEANDQFTIAISTPVDIVVSLISWGFHYPVSIYLQEVNRILSPHGTLIIDVRKGSDGRDQLENVFHSCAPILTTQKFERLVCKKSVNS